MEWTQTSEMTHYGVFGGPVLLNTTDGLMIRGQTILFCSFKENKAFVYAELCDRIMGILWTDDRRQMFLFVFVAQRNIWSTITDIVYEKCVGTIDNQFFYGDTQTKKSKTKIYKMVVEIVYRQKTEYVTLCL